LPAFPSTSNPALPISPQRHLGLRVVCSSPFVFSTLALPPIGTSLTLRPPTNHCSLLALLQSIPYLPPIRTKTGQKASRQGSPKMTKRSNNHRQLPLSKNCH
jgi:hypothetical protein